MGSAPVRRDPDTLLDSSLRRGTYVAPGVYGAYRLRRRPAGPPLAPQTVGDWITPPEQTESGSFTSHALSSRGESYHPITGTVDFPTSLAEAYAGYDTAGAEEVLNTSYAGAGDDLHALAQIDDVTVSFFYPPWEPTIPDGATVEYESGAGFPTSDATVTATMRVNTSGESDGYGASLLATAPGTVPDWWTPTDMGAMTLIFAVPWLADVGGVVPASDIEFTFTDDVYRWVTAWDLIVEAQTVSAPIYGGNATYLSLGAERTYQPPRYRFHY